MMIIFLFFSHLWAQNLITISEQSNWVRTGRYDEVISLCRAFEKTYPRFVKCQSYGKSPENRPLLYLHVRDFSQKSAPIKLWVQSGIHAGEVDGKDAGFWLLKDLLKNPEKRKVFSKVELIFIPALSPDSHERFSAYNRPNQVGPLEMGWRVTSHNLNLNRDFLKAEAPEMQALLKLWHKINPHVSLDLHVTNGAQFKPQIGYVVSPTTHSGLTPHHLVGSQIEKSLIQGMTDKKWLPLPFYPELEDSQDPKKGFSRYVPGPRFSHGYWRLQGKIGVLVESHSWKDYVTRVKLHRDTVDLFLTTLSQHPEWAKVIEDYDSFRQSYLPLSFKTTDKFRILDFPAFKYDIRTSPFTGEKVVVYSKEEDMWKVPLYEKLIVDKKIPKPTQGYFVPVQESDWIKEKLKLHAIKFEVLPKALEKNFQVFRATKTEFSAEPYEGHQTLKLEGEWQMENSSLPAGSLYIPIAQKNAELIARMLEPQSSDSFLFWGYFNRYYEQKEYMEDYVLEMVAQEMMKDPKVKAEFKERLKEAAFGESKDERFDFFYRRHPSWDKNYRRYPVFKL